MKTSVRAFLASLGLLLSAGCTAVTVSNRGDHRTVVVQNTCCKLFCCLPIVSGDPDYPNKEVSNWFEDTMTLETNLRLLDEAIQKSGGVRCGDISSYRNSEYIIPILLKRYMLTTSAEIVK